MAKFHTTPAQNSGIPLGGIGTGTIELRPDGEFHEWQISNQTRWSTVCGGDPAADDGENLAGALSFILRTQEEGQPNSAKMRRLGFGMGCGGSAEEYNNRMYTHPKPVEEIHYEGTFPMTTLDYIDKELPVAVTLEALSPFVPHEQETAGTPGFYLTFRLENISKKPVAVALAGKLRNIICREAPDGNRVNRVITGEGYTALAMAALHDGESADNGSVALGVKGGEHSWIAGEYAAYMNEFVAGDDAFGVTEESFVFALQRDGNLPNTTLECEQLGEAFDASPDELNDAQLDELLAQLRKNAYAQSLLERALIVQPDLIDTTEGKRSALRYVQKIRGDLRKGGLRERHGAWGDGTLCSSLTLAAGETAQVMFTLAWHFPNHFSETGRLLGHHYQNRFDDAAQVTEFLMGNADYIRGKARGFAENLYHTSFDPVFADAWAGQLATLIKCSWWLKDGSFGIWEGLGSCGFHTTDITFHGSFGLLSLFPELQKQQMRMGARFQREDGRVHHFFTPDLYDVDNGFDRVDMNPQFVLLVCRDFRFTGDMDYLNALWPHIERAMDNIALLDQNGDGLPDTETKRNTYDSWNFSGTPSYISILWLAALRAARYLALKLDIEPRAEQWGKMLKTGCAGLEEKLWNGAYYDLWMDEERRDGCCMASQLDGEWFARFSGIGGVLPEARVKQTLQSVLEHNFSQERGLVNASYPAGSAATIHTFRNCQAVANWSGVEYAMASLCGLFGLEAEALSVVRQIDDRHRRLGQYWNHAECGNHYYRPLSSWALMGALTGFLYCADSKTLTLENCPMQAPFHAPWVTTTGWGQLEFTGREHKITCLDGNLDIQSIIVGLPVEAALIFLNGEPLPCGMKAGVLLGKGDVLTVEGVAR